MNCCDYLLLLSGHIDGVNSQEDENALQAHLCECEECRILLREMTSNDNILKSEKIAIPTDLTDRIMNKISRTKKKAYLSLAASGLIAAILAVAVFSALPNAPKQNPATTSQTLELRQTRISEPTAQEEIQPAEANEENVCGLVLPDGMKTENVIDRVAVLVLRAEADEITFSREMLQLYELTDFLSESAYYRTGDETAFYAVSWQTLTDLAETYKDIIEMEKYYLDDVQYMRAMVVFTK